MTRLATLLCLIAVCAVAAAPPFKIPGVRNGTSGGGSSTLNTSLVAYWQLDEASGTRNDSQGANHLTDNNTVTSAAGKIGNAAQFTTANSEYLSISDNADISVGAGVSFSMAVWAYMDTLQNQGIISKYGAGGNRDYLLWYYTVSGFNCDVSDDGSSLVTAVGGTASTATWYHLYMEYDTATKKASIAVNNGTLASSSATVTAGVFDGTNPFKLGSNDGEINFFNGRLDEAAFWKRILTASERTELYNAGSGKTCCPFAAWPMNDRGTPCLAHFGTLQHFATK